MGAASFAFSVARTCGGLVLVEQAEQVGEILVVDLLHERAELARVLAEELPDLGHDRHGHAQHGGETSQIGAGRKGNPRVTPRE